MITGRKTIGLLIMPCRHEVTPPVKLRHLDAHFGGWLARRITTKEVREYERARLDSGAARATVNDELSALRRMFNLAREEEVVDKVSVIKTSDPKNARERFFEADDFEALMAELPEELVPVMRFRYLTGWRMRSEVLPLQWRNVDFDAGVVRLEPNTTKNREGREFPFDVLPELDQLLRERRAVASKLACPTTWL